MSEIGFVNYNLKPTNRRTCKMIKDYILKYMFYYYPNEFRLIDGYSFVLIKDDKYKAIFNTVIDELENNGYISCETVCNIVRKATDPNYYALWFDES